MLALIRGNRLSDFNSSTPIIPLESLKMTYIAISSAKWKMIQLAIIPIFNTCHSVGKKQSSRSWKYSWKKLVMALDSLKTSKNDQTKPLGTEPNALARSR